MTDSKVSNMLYLVEFQYKCDYLQFPTHLFTKIALEWEEYLPGDINDMNMFKIKCLPREENGIRDHMTSGTSRCIHHEEKS